MRVAVDQTGRIDKLLARLVPGLGRAEVSRLCSEGKVVLVRGERRRRVRKAELTQPGDVIELERESAAAGADATVALDVLLETAEVVVIDKPAGLASAAIRGGELGTAASGLVARYPEMAGVGFSPREPGLCHRLDTATSGLLLAARTPEAFDELTAAIRASQLDKRYLLVCLRAPLSAEGEIDLALASAGARVVVSDEGRPARTRYRVLREHRGLALVEASAPRAQRHQIRVHFAAIGAPLAGDGQYGGDTSRLPHRHALHASRIAYAGGARVPAFDVSSPLPAELDALLATSA
jgi:23S rRNA pseudouridine1911/1915/1917 synthase